MSQYVHKSLIGFILMGLENVAPDFAKQQAWARLLLDSGNELLALDVKKKLLRNILEQGGPQLILDITRHYEKPPPSPIIDLFLNSDSPLSLVQKIEQYDHYLHSNHRLQIEQSGDKFMVLNHLSIDKQPVSPGEEFFMCGVLTAMLTKIGCQDVRFSWRQLGNPELRAYLDPVIRQQTADGEYSTWLFEWRAFCAQQQRSEFDAYLAGLSVPVDTYDSATFSAKVDSLLRRDPGQAASLQGIADKLALSRRTLQRALQKENNSFARILRQVRISVSTKLLIETEFSISEIGFMSGFADHAHFSREWKKHKGQTPFDFRRMNKNCANEHHRDKTYPQGRR